MPRQAIDLTGQIYGQLTVLRDAFREGYWECRCTCGTECKIKGSSLRSGNTKSCGCLRRKLATTIFAGRTRDVISPKPQVLESDLLADPEFVRCMMYMRETLKLRGVVVKTGKVETHNHWTGDRLYKPKKIWESKLLPLAYALLHTVTVQVHEYERSLPPANLRMQNVSSTQFPRALPVQTTHAPPVSSWDSVMVDTDNDEDAQ